MDNLALQALIDELRPQLLRRRCAQIVQLRSTTLALEWTDAERSRLVFEFGDPPLCFLTSKTFALLPPSPFVGLMRKWLMGAELTAITKHLDERIVHFELSGSSLSPSTQTFSLVAEVVPRWGNLYLLDSQHSLLGSLMPSRAERRKLDVGSRYTPPLKHGDASIDVFASGSKAFPTLPTDLAGLTKHVRGLSPLFAQEILHRSRLSDQDPSTTLRLLLTQISAGKFQPCVYRIPSQAAKWVISPIMLESVPEQAACTFVSMNAAAESVFEKQVEAEVLETERKRLHREMQSAWKKFKRIEEKVDGEAAAFDQDVELQKIADLILAQSDKWHPQGGRVQLVNVFDSRQPKLTVAIDPRLGAVGNAQRFYEKAKRARRGLEKIRTRQTILRQMLQGLEAGLGRLALAHSLAEMEDISRSLRPDTIKPAVSSANVAVTTAARLPLRPKKRKCRVFRSSDDYEILVGRNSKENDLVTTQYASADDYWFHVADYTGSHVVLRNPRRETLEETDGFLEAAQLAAYYSQARNARKVVVHWTQRKFVKKPKRAKAGLVTLSKFQSVTVEPKLPHSAH